MYWAGSGCDHEFAWWAGLQTVPSLADVIQPSLLQVQGELPVDRVTHQLRVGRTAHLVGRADHALTDGRKQLVADGGRADAGRGPRGAPDLDVPGAAGRCGGQADVDGLVICEVDDPVGPAVCGLFEGLSASGRDDPAGARDPNFDPGESLPGG